ncbi:hypothetical protein [Acinetobacter lwoffii]|uniref:hypothetical protein n=1 Tax=Acinetobacter lwoffii TaxID=28090 RepID=UPI002DB8034F|nr:hypothetical protein [Acinetobacter lwoffii]MEB6681030.1 hypothetical protein [Acinetobacter lwoffii]
MISNNYVPEWYISPFEHSKYTLVRNQDQFDLLFDDVGDTQEFLHLGTGAQVDYYDGGKHCIVQLGDCSERTLIEVHGLLLHEAVHIWQRIKKLMGEDEPSIEFEAYSIQRIAQDLFSMFEESEVSNVLD